MEDNNKICDICCSNDYNYVCSSCKTKMCHECIKRYIMTYPNLDPHCMNCNVALPFPVIYDSLGKFGINKFFTDSAEMKFQLERQKIPDCLKCCNQIMKIKQFQTVPKIILNILLEISHISYPTITNNELKAAVVGINETAFNYQLSILKTIQQLAQQHPFYINTSVSGSDDNATSAGKKPVSVSTVAASAKAHKLALDKAKTLKEIINEDSQKNSNLKLSPFWKSRDIISFFANIKDSIIAVQHENYIELRKQLIKEYRQITDVSFETFRTFKPNTRTTLYNNDDSIYETIISFERRNANKELGSSKKSHYLFRCSNGDCKGFVQSSNWSCELCSHVYCDKCFKDITDQYDHKCNNDDVESAKLILESTKPCPRCAARIFKIKGCSQMFCTNCHVGFDWNTGKIITHEFHNPHRLEWLANQLHNGNSRNNNNVCFDAFDILNVGVHSTFVEAHRLISIIPEYERRRSQFFHFRNVVLPQWRTKLNEISRFDFRNRCLFVLNMITEQEYKDYLSSQIKNEHKFRLIVRIYENFINSLSDVLAMTLQQYQAFIDKLKQNEYSDMMIRCWDKLIELEAENKIIEAACKWEEIEQSETPTMAIFKGWLRKNANEVWRYYQGISPNEFKLFKELPTFSRASEVLEMITNEANDSLKSYCKMFKISQITMPTNFNSDNRYSYYKVK